MLFSFVRFRRVVAVVVVVVVVVVVARRAFGRPVVLPSFTELYRVLPSFVPTRKGDTAE